MRLNSLATRLFFSATAWSILVLIVVGFALSAIYRTGQRFGVGYLVDVLAGKADPRILKNKADVFFRLHRQQREAA